MASLRRCRLVNEGGWSLERDFLLRIATTKLRRVELGGRTSTIKHLTIHTLIFVMTCIVQCNNDLLITASYALVCPVRESSSSKKR